MRKMLLHISLIAGVILFTGLDSEGQVIPDSTSSEVLNMFGEGGFNARTVWYYKPTTYDSATSPILWVMHGIGGTGEGAIGWVQNIAENRKALIVAPNASYMDWAYSYELGTDTNCVNGNYMTLLPNIFKQIYRNVLTREGRDTIPVYFTGFSAGGQTVTRYMLIRQLVPDSIPIKMAVSVNPYYYTLCLDSIFGNEQKYPCGIALKNYKYSGCHYPPPWNNDTLTVAFCNDHIIQYYNENYGVLIGTADTIANYACNSAFGANRYERAQFFYNYSDTNAITRGTTLQWVYDTVSGVGHTGWAMYNTAIIWLDTSIAEHMIFDTPWHPVPQLAPIADFKADNREIWLLTNPTVQFTNKSMAATSYVWDFGDTTYSTAVSPSHTYTYAGIFTVRLRAYNGNGCESYKRKWDYIIVRDGVGVSEVDGKGGEVKVYPNPAKDEFIISGNYNVPSVLELYNIIGEKVRSEKVKQNKAKIDVSGLARGLYVWQLETARGKLIVE